MIGKPLGNQSDGKNMDRSALVNKCVINKNKSARKCSYYKKNGHMVDYCWDLHLEKRTSRSKDDHKGQGKNQWEKKSQTMIGNTSSGTAVTEEKRKKIATQIKNLQVLKLE